MKIKATYDKSVHAGYIWVDFSKRGQISRTIEAQAGVLVDIDSAGRVVGIELLSPSQEFLDEAKWRE